MKWKNCRWLGLIAGRLSANWTTAILTKSSVLAIFEGWFTIWRKNLTDFGKFCRYAIGQVSFDASGQILKNNFAIWSHWVPNPSYLALARDAITTSSWCRHCWLMAETRRQLTSGRIANPLEDSDGHPFGLPLIVDMSSQKEGNTLYIL